ncbi:hypothetical protein E2C01_058047 [Portunus trituberculatus]|uniref:Uncharacterized protein n=1 Tax=Portunus trituberculatus TaxID=210409 RepID=A0A5B7GV57_PORTR|nr:hypothetical protein [Portunus trituberculatus]
MALVPSLPPLQGRARVGREPARRGPVAAASSTGWQTQVAALPAASITLAACLLLLSHSNIAIHWDSVPPSAACYDLHYMLLLERIFTSGDEHNSFKLPVGVCDLITEDSTYVRTHLKVR